MTAREAGAHLPEPMYHLAQGPSTADSAGPAYEALEQRDGALGDTSLYAVLPEVNSGARAMGMALSFSLSLSL